MEYGREKTLLVEREAARQGAMPPLHVRSVDETCIVVDGTITFFVGTEVVTGRKGDTIRIPAGRPRTYRIDSEGARWRVLTTVRSAVRFEEFGRALAVPVGRSWTPEDEATVAAIGAENGIEILGSPGTLPADLQAARAAA
jgi:quercetin dioxygenase-like cupin family protein